MSQAPVLHGLRNLIVDFDAFRGPQVANSATMPLPNRWNRILTLFALLFLPHCLALLSFDQVLEGRIKENVEFRLEWEGARGPVQIELLYWNTNPSTRGFYYYATLADNWNASYALWTPNNMPSGVYAISIWDHDGEAESTPQRQTFTYIGSKKTNTITSTTVVYATASITELSFWYSSESRMTTVEVVTVYTNLPTTSSASPSRRTTLPPGPVPTHSDGANVSDPPQTLPPQGGGDTASPDRGGLSTGAKAGIGVGASLGGIILIGTVIFILYRRGKTAQNGSGNDSGGVNIAELGVKTRAEMATQANVHELYYQTSPWGGAYSNSFGGAGPGGGGGGGGTTLGSHSVIDAPAPVELSAAYWRPPPRGD
ncbi:hypothetical protein B0H63DRAFT_561709 [Podospora didyma]|uniref:Mid2 domain-containing protein n=1 Tax=Podospora didyma TaxID=330526 RepID=A0AAE0KJW0_9PEZI|nr:hypothetical protein B0H63DRAFT_561709 [Podospora didyma]